MTDPQNPAQSTPEGANVPPAPPAYSPEPTAPPAAPVYGQQPYASAPPPAYGAPASPTIPGRTMGIVAFVLSFFVQLIALILGIIALVQSKKAGHKNGFALAAIIISSVLIVVGIIVGIVLITIFGAAAAEYARLCAEYGTGVHEIGGVTVTLSCPSS